MAARPPPSGAGGSGSSAAQPRKKLTKLSEKGENGTKDKREKPDKQRKEKKRSKSEPNGDAKQKKDRAHSSSKDSSQKRSKKKDGDARKRARVAGGLELLDIRPRSNWKPMSTDLQTRCLSMVDHALLMARNSEKGNSEHSARLDKNLNMLRERVAALLSDLRVPPRTQATAKDASEKQRKIEESIVATRELLASVKHDHTFETQALVAETEREQDLAGEVAVLQKRLQELITQKTHPILRHRSKDVTAWPVETPLQPTSLEVLIKETDDPEFERLKAATARHLTLLPAHEAAVAPVLEGLSRLKEQLVQLLDPEL